jgi:hypothetical protein
MRGDPALLTYEIVGRRPLQYAATMLPTSPESYRSRSDSAAPAFYCFAEPWKDSGGSSEHCRQNAVSETVPSASPFTLDIAEAICPPSAESKTITIPSVD